MIHVTFMVALRFAWRSEVPLTHGSRPRYIDATAAEDGKHFSNESQI
jgi:hypothetical protein